MRTVTDPNVTSSLPLLPLRDGVLLPGTVATIPVGRPASIALVTAVAHISAEARGVPYIPAYVASLSAAWQAQDAAAA